MLINIEEIKAAPGRQKSFSLRESFRHANVEYELLSPLEFEAVAENKGEYILLTGKLCATLAIPCAACLKEISYALETDFCEAYAQDREIPDSEGELDIHSFSGSVICPDDELAGAIALALPMRLLCRPDCRGLCPHCGADLNEGSCGCEAEYIDPRLAALKNFQFDATDKEV